MRLYGKKNIRRLIDKRAKRRQEIRDAILWEIDGEKCRIKIQGSNTMVVAHFPRNQKKVPLWLRVGNAVKVVHREGIRGYIEVIGEGRCIPTAVSGGSLPETGDLSDGVISGLVVTVANAISYAISPGTYRYNGIIYASGGTSIIPNVMNDPAPMTMGEVPIVKLNDASDPVLVRVIPPYGYARYELIYLDGPSGELCVAEGGSVLITQLGCDGPEMPELPLEAIQLAFALLVGNNRDVSNADLYEEWEDPYYCYFEWEWGQGYKGEIDSPWKPGDDPIQWYDAVIINVCYSQYYVPLYGEIEMALGSAYGDIWPPEKQDYILFDYIFGTPLYHPSSHLATWKIRLTIKKDEPVKVLICDIRHGDWIPENDPIYSIMIIVSIRRKSRALNEDGIMLEDGSTVGNYLENTFWIGRDVETGEVLPFGGDMEEITDVWKKGANYSG